MIDFIVVVSGFGIAVAAFYATAAVKDGLSLVDEIANIKFMGY